MGEAMSRKSLTVTVVAFAFAVVLTPGAGSALGASGPAKSPLPGYPRFRGVMLAHDGSAASVAREQAIRAALKTTPSSTNPNCTLAGTNPGADLCWWGGSVVTTHTVHLIFWEGPSGHKFPPEYIEKVETYFSKVALASKTPGEANSSVYSVDTQYAGSNGPVTFKASFGSPADVFVDKVDVLPAAGTLSTQCKDASFSTCITDEDLHKEVEVAELAKSWKSSLEDIFFVVTPPNVGSCFEAGSSESGDVCALVEGGYCAYHSDFGAPGEQTLYANIPDVGNVEGCDPVEHPNGAEGVDATLDTASHEHNETITDPLGSQTGEKNAWLDLIGQEIGDKCLPPETFNIYGQGFEGSEGEFSNQLIGGGRYFLQREWSNTAFNGEGGCVGRLLNTSFTPPSEPTATIPATFDGSTSGEPGDPAVYWVWSFGDLMQVGTPEAKISHTYAEPGVYRVTLTAFDEHGNSNTHSTFVEVGAAPPPPPPPTPITIKELVTVKEQVTVKEASVPGRLTVGQIAAKLGLPGDGAELSGNGLFAVGHAACPPACGVILRLYAKETKVSHKHRTSRWVVVGSAHVTLSAKGTGVLSLSLNAKGKTLLRKLHKLACKLVVTVEGQEGGSWQIVRSLTIRR
jgi:hypothetical protein